MNQCLAIVGPTKSGKTTKLNSLEQEFKEKGYDVIRLDWNSPTLESDFVSLDERMLGRKELMKKHKAIAKTVEEFKNNVGPIKNIAILIDEVDLSNEDVNNPETSLGKLTVLLASRRTLGLDFIFTNQSFTKLPASIRSNCNLTIECNTDYTTNIKLGFTN